MNYPPRKNFAPQIDTGTSKALSGGQEAVTYAADFTYQAGAITYAAQKRLPLLDDGSGLALPFHGRYKDNAPVLATLLAVESLGLVLPDLPLMTPRELVDFRFDNAKELQNFRASMLRFFEVAQPAAFRHALS